MEGYRPYGDNFQSKPYAADFFSKDISLDNLYWWNQLKLSDPGKGTDSTVTVRSDSLNSIITKNCIYRKLPFVYKTVRDALKQVLKYTMEIPYGVYAPIGVSFGDGNTLDLSQDNAFVAFTFKNTLATTLDVRIELQDVKRKVINSLPLTRTIKPNDMYTEEVKFQSIFPGETRNIKVNFNPKAYPATPYFANYPKDTCNRFLTPSKDFSYLLGLGETKKPQQGQGFKNTKFNITAYLSVCSEVAIAV